MQVPKGAGALVFRDPRHGVVLTYLKGTGANAYHDVTLQPENGLLVLFPNWLEHRVEPNDSDTARIAISFNALRG